MGEDDYGALSIDTTPNLDDPSLDVPDVVDDTDGESIDDIAPTDNTNGSSNTDGNTSPLLDSMFAGGTDVSNTIDALTNGANSLGDDLAGLINPTQANVPATTGGLSSNGLLLIGGGILAAFLIL